MTPGTRRLFTACLLALAIAAPIAALTPQAQAPTWPSSPTTLYSQEGDVSPSTPAATGITASTFRATNHQSGMTYQILSGTLPAGISLSSAGVLTGTLAPSDADTNNGSAGTYTLTIRATTSGGTADHQITWQVSRFRKGDVFAGIGGGKYQVFDENGTYKYTLTAETAAEHLDDDVNVWGWPQYTTGCGYNWVSRKLYFTSFAEDDRPNVNVLDPVPADRFTGDPTLAFPRSKIYTTRDPGLEPGKSGTPDPNTRSVDNAPESVVFDRQGNMFVGHAGGYYTIMGSGDWVAGTHDDLAVHNPSLQYLNSSGALLTSSGSPIDYPKGTTRAGVLENYPSTNGAGNLAGNPIGLTQWGRDLQKFVYNASTGQMTRSESFDTFAAFKGTDWIDLAADQETIFYTSEWGAIYRYNTAAGVAAQDRQLEDFALLAPIGDQSEILYALRILPPGDGTAGVLVAGKSQVFRLNADGAIVTQYDAAGVDGWFALNISPDGKTVWSASTVNGRIYKWEIASGRLLTPDGIATAASPAGLLNGLCVMGEYTAAQEVCGNGVDDDGDGVADENCTPIEVCSNISPGDDDLDGLVDTNDPDCGATNICASSGYTANSVAGFCSRHNFEGDLVSLLPAPGGTGSMVDTYEITGVEISTSQPGLPPGITAGTNGILSGVPPHTMILNTATPLTRSWRIRVEVTRRDTSRAGSPIVADFTHEFDWTIENRNRPPVATDHTRTTRPATAVTLDVLAADPVGLGSAAADSDPDAEDTITVTGHTNPSNGTVSRTGALVTYTPNANFTGSDSFTYTISDGRGGTATGKVAISTSNGPPVAVADSAVTRPGRPVSIAVLANDTDPDPGDSVSFVRIDPNNQPRFGTVTVSSGVITYTPSLSAPTDIGESFGYEITDSSGATASARVTVAIINAPPVGGPDFASTRPGLPVTISVLSNDSDPDAPPTPAAPDTLSIIANSTPNPVAGTVVRSGNNFVYTPAPGWLGMVPFAYTLSDGFGGTAIVRVEVTTANRPPDAVDDAGSIRPGGSIAINVVTNDTDPDNSPDVPPSGPDPMTITSFTQPAHGTLTRSGTTFTYTASLSNIFLGVDTFTYTIEDGFGGSDTATVRITIANRAPDAVNDSASTRPGQAVTISVLANDTDPDNSPDVPPAGPDAMTITANTNPSNGTVTCSTTTCTYTPNANFTGSDSFTYTISDGYGGSDTATVTINSVNTRPDAVDDTATTRPGLAVAIPVISNDTDPESDTLTFTANTTPSNGTVTCSGASCTYTPNATFVGTDSFTYTVSDGFGGSDTATVRITVINNAPDAVNDTATTRPGQAVTISVLANDTDPDNSPDIAPSGPDPMTITARTNGSNGTVTCTSTSLTGTCTYTSDTGFAGVDTFTYTISDGFGGTDTATVTVNVRNTPPDAVNDSFSMIAGGSPITFDVRANDPADADGDTVTLTSFTQPAGGTVVRNTNGTFTFTPNTGFSGVTTFTYTLSDGFGGTDTATVTIDVVNTPPIARDDSAATNGTNPVTVTVLANDNDPDNHVISVTGATTPANGSVVVNANGTIKYTANSGFQGTDSFFYTIRDGFGGESTARVTITVGPPNRFDSCTCATAKASPAILWPPNHKQVEVVNVTSLVDPDNGQPLSIRILGIYQDEPTNYLGDGDTTIDGFGVGTSTASVRAERTGNPNVPGNGRVYEIVFEATAADGSNCQGSVYTGVPHDQGQGNYVFDDGIRYDSTVAGGTIVRNALRIESNLTDADVTAREFTAKYVAEARIGGGSSVPELLLGPVSDLDADTEHFNWTSGQDVVFLLLRVGNSVHFKLLTANQFEFVSQTITCANGDCDDIFIRAQAGGTGTITLSSLNINGLSVPDTLAIPVGGSARSLHLSGLSMSDGVLLGGIAKIEWTGTKPTGSTVNFKIQVGTACPTEGGTGGGGTGTPPLARTDAYATQEDTPLIVNAANGVIANDLTFAGALSATLIDPPSNGTVTLSSNGAFTYTPNAGFNGQDTYRYTVSDGALNSQPGLVTITVAPVIDPPNANNDSATTNERAAVTIAVLGNDSDWDGGAVTIASLTQPSNGTAAISGSNIVYTPNSGFIGTDTFTYTVNGDEGSDTATVSVTVVNVNEPPVAVNNSYTTQEDTPLTISAPGVRANDSDPDAGDTFTAVLVTGPANGTLTLNANGSFTYTPNANYNGTDSFTYRARDAGGLDSNVATVSITISAVNDPPNAVNDSHVVVEDGVLQINAPGVKQNDTDPDTAASNLTVTLESGVQRGTLTLMADGSFMYTPLPNISGSDSFVYRLSDGTASSVATVTIAITESPDPPVAADDAATTSEDSPVTIPVLPNDSDADGSTLTVQSVTQGQNGTVAIVGTQVRYTPRANFYGSDTFTYTITDGTSTATAKVVVTVNSVNDAPTAQPDTYTTSQNTVLNVQTPGVAGNDTDPDNGQNLTVVMGAQPANGTVVMQSQGAFSYTPNNDFTGTDTFTYKVTDGTAESPSTTVTITVTATNRPPVAANDAYSTNRNTALTIAAPGILSNDTDPDQGNTLTASLISTTPASTGTLVLNPNGSFTFTPVTDFTGQATFRYRARDNANADSNEAIVTITVNASNRPPVNANDSYSTDKNKPLTVNAPGILSNDSDPDQGNTITAVLVTGPPASAGTLTLNANGSFTFTPATDYVGTTTFTYRARDNNDANSDNPATVTIEVKNIVSSGQVCYDGGSNYTQMRATLDWNRLENGDIRVRATVSRNYADNTYGVNKIGWGNKKRDFAAVYKSDFGRIAFYDANGARKIEFKIDYLSPKSGTPSGYGSLGVGSGQQADGGMVFGSASNIVALGTSMDLNFNGFGYVTTSSNHPLKSYSPPTNTSYATNATYPLWIWDMWYEATVSASTFGSAGFGYPRLTGLHASPAKVDINSWRLITCQ